jgi:hypothetical protein
MDYGTPPLVGIKMNRRTFIKTAAISSAALMTGNLAIAATEPIKYDFIEPKYLLHILKKLREYPSRSTDYDSPVSSSISEMYKNYCYITPEMMKFEEKIYIPLIGISNILRRTTLGENSTVDKTWVVLSESEIDLFNFTGSSLKHQETGHPLMKYWGACCCAWPLYTYKYWPKGWFLLGHGKVLRKKRSQYATLQVKRKEK